MTLEAGMRLPDADLLRMGPDGPETVTLSSKLGGRKVVVFALPGAFTGVCSTAHLPSFIRTADAFKEKGVEEIICISVNDPFALHEWGAATGAHDAGITLLGDASGDLTRSLKMDFTVPQIGLYGRSNRYALLVDDGVVSIASIDEPGVCDVSTGERLLEKL
ncbi:MAG: peroxiredoxin [Pseudomonadota bacterium]